MSVVLLDREVVHYESLGRGRPLLLLHSWVGSWRYWIPAMQAACGSFRVYALDLWGYGDSSKNIGLFSFESQVSLVERFLNEMGIARVAMVGHGLGAVLSEVFARAFPQRVDRLMHISFPYTPTGLVHLLSSTSTQSLVDWLMDRESFETAVRVEAQKADPRARAFSARAVTQMDLDGMLKYAALPKLFVYGAKDALPPPPAGDQSDRLPESSHLVIMEESGHYPMLQETSRFNRLLLDFISLPPGESPRLLQLKEEWKRRVR